MSEMLAAVKELLKDALIVVLVLREAFAQRARDEHEGVNKEARRSPGTATYEELARELDEAKAREERLKQEVEEAKVREERRIRETREAKEAERWREIRKVETQRAEDRLGGRDTSERGEIASAAPQKAAQELSDSEARRDLRDIIPARTAQYEAKMRWLGRGEGFFHVAVAGVFGGGKSSLINAFRGLRNTDSIDKGAAPIGVTQTTGEVTRYPGRVSRGTSVVWYDVPGAGAPVIPRWHYFTDQGFYVDCIVVVVDVCLTEIDVAILRDAVRFQIPSFIVRSKSRQRIAEILSDDDEGEAIWIRKERARKKYIRETQCQFALELDQANLLVQRVYLVDKDVLVRVARGELPASADVIDESALWKDMFELVRTLSH